MNLEEELYLVGENIKRDAPSWKIDLNDPANEHTLWTVFDDRMTHCGSQRSLEAIYRLADQHIGLKRVYVAVGPQKWLGVLKYERAGRG
jgi:hypothetical protein